MIHSDSPHRTIDHPLEIQALLQRFFGAGGRVRLRCPQGSGHGPVVVAPESADGVLRVDISAVKDRMPTLEPDAVVRLVHEQGGDRVCTGDLSVLRRIDTPQGSFLLVSAPTMLEQRQRREAFRARLLPDMRSYVELRRGARTVQGKLIDISLGGCQVGCAPGALHIADAAQGPLALEIVFPDGTMLHLQAMPCHRRIADQRLLIGLRFLNAHPQRQQIWAIVHEIERDAACSAAPANAQDSLRSGLFAGEALADRAAAPACSYRTAMAERLAPVALFLLSQVLRLRGGGELDGPGLAKSAELLLALQREDRQALLYALACLHDQPAVIAHGIAVASRLLDLGSALGQPPQTLKAVAAAALIHDLGKMLLPASMLEARALDAGQRRALHAHVRLIREPAGQLDWIPRKILDAVIEGCNERLDGSGYPRSRTSQNMTGLMKLAAVVDVADAMARARPDRGPHPLSAIHAHLLGAPHQYDARWVRQYVAHFGRWPVGSLVSFARGQAGWVEAVGEQGQPVAVRPLNRCGPSADTALGRVSGSDLLHWGPPRAALVQPLGNRTAVVVRQELGP